MSRYLWPLRVPILSGLLLVGLPWLAFWPSMRPFLSGLFDPIDNRALLLITALALFNAWTTAIIAALILTYGSVRLDLPELGVKLFPVKRAVWIGSSLLALPVIIVTVWYAGRVSDPGRLGGLLVFVAAGAGVALLLLVAGIWSEARLRNRESWLRKMVSALGLDRWYARLLGILARWPSLSAGFLLPNEAAEHPQLAPGHGVALGLASGSVFLYIATGFLTRNVQRPQLASALAYVLLLLLILTWLAGVVAFLVDRSRLPLVAFLLAWILIVNIAVHPVFSTDHIYRTVAISPNPPRLATPVELFGGSDRPIAVAASGGGIQAAAWTARVLTGLESATGFSASVRLISAVSGGSAGAMNVMAASANCGPPLDPAARHDFDANAASRESSLHAAGWGLVFKDLPRTIAPFFSSPVVDRGSVLEDAWKREDRLKRPYPDESPLLASWRRNVPEQRCPGVIYNAMAAETGEPVLFSTVALPRGLQPFDFYERYPGRDVPVSTAVRLSAGFPYVSPATRADADDQKSGYTHLVDGGYFDNYGVSTLAAVINAGLTQAQSLPGGRRHLLILEICDASACSGQEPPPTPSAGGPDRAWPYQLVAPLSAVVAVRAAAQRASNRTSLRLLKDAWRARKMCIESVQVPFGEGPAPLSWHLTSREKQAIDAAWSRLAASTTEAVAKFLAGRAATAEGEQCLTEQP